MKFLFQLSLLLILLTQVVSCSDAEEVDKNNESKVVSEKVDETVLVTVEGEDITESDLEFSMVEALGFSNRMQLGEGGESRFLESMVASKSMARLSMKSLDESERIKLRKKINAYKEQLLVKMYLKDNIVPEPVSAKMVKDYYLSHPGRFGSEMLIDYTILRVKNLSENDRKNTLKTLSDTESLTFFNLNKKLNNSGVDTEFVTKRLLKNASNKDKESKVALSLKEGEMSSVFFINSQPNIIKVEKFTTTPPKPLHEVSLQIRKSLVPVQLKKAIKEASAMALKQTTVIYQ